MIVMGIDPGLTGALAVFNTDGSIRCESLPVMQNAKAAEKGRNRQHLNPQGLAFALRPYMGHRCMVYLEYTQAGMKGALANYSLGHSSGVIMGVLASLGLPYELVRPQEWKAAFQLLKQKKDASRTVAQQLFPHVDLSKVKDEGRAEALLIAEWGRRQMKEGT